MKQPKKVSPPDTYPEAEACRRGAVLRGDQSRKLALRAAILTVKEAATKPT